MAWNTEETRRRLKEAAAAEFAAHGLAGTKIDTIAAQAGINKERIYNYFGGKEQLFSLVLADELAKIAEAVPLETIATEGIGSYAGRCFDYHVAHPELVRLLHWEALELEGEVPDEEARTAHYQRKVAIFADAQRSGTLADRPAPADAVFLILAICTWWVAAPQVARMVLGAPVEDALAEHRAAVVLTAERMFAGAGS